MPDPITLSINHRPIMVDAGTSVAAAIAIADVGGTRRSVSGTLRAPLCGMGICQECRVTIDGIAHRLACQTTCESHMQVLTTHMKAST